MGVVMVGVVSYTLKKKNTRKWEQKDSLKVHRASAEGTVFSSVLLHESLSSWTRVGQNKHPR